MGDLTHAIQYPEKRPDKTTKIIRSFSTKPANSTLDRIHRITDREFEVFYLIGED